MAALTKRSTRRPVNYLHKLSAAQIGATCAWIAVLIYAAGNAVATLLVQIGEANPLADGSNAITFTKLLFLGSLISLIPLTFLFRRDWNKENLQKLTGKDWGLMTVSATLSSALTPGLFFFALEHSNVTNVILISRIEPPLFLLAACLFLKERLESRALIAGLIAMAGALTMFALRADAGGNSFGLGEIAAAAATLSFIASTLVTRHSLKQIPVGVFSIYRTILGAVIYYALIRALQGPCPFQDLFAPVLLKWVWVYALLIIVIGQLCWNQALRHARAGDVTIATSFSPLAGLMIAMLLLGENPGPGLLPGGGLILLAIALKHDPSIIVGKMRQRFASCRNECESP